MGLYFPVNPPMKQDILPHKNVCPMAFYPLNYENRYHPCFRLWIHSRSAAVPKANSQSTRLSDTQNQQGFVGTPLIMHSSVLTTGKGFIRTCWIFCLFCLNLFIFNGRIIKKKTTILCWFLHTSTWISHRYTYAPPFQVVTEPWFEFPESFSEFPESFSKFPLVIYFPYGNMFPCYSLYSLLSSQPHLLPSAHVHKSRTGWTLSCSSNCWIKSSRCL